MQKRHFEKVLLRLEENVGITKTRWWVNPTTALAYNNLQKL